MKSFKETPGIDWWSEERIVASMQATLAKRSHQEPVWLFAYGSLIWNPQFHFVEKAPALLEGWRRSFCMRLIAGRGCLEQPGRMLSLAPGGQTQGLALRLAEETLEQELLMVWLREMVGGSYQPDWATLRLDDGRQASAIIFRADPQGAFHEDDDSIETISPLITSAHGILGSNKDYVFQLEAALNEHKFRDDYVHALAAHLKQIKSA
ncbi:MAG: gamma-glutamylcyclotransferase [Alcaligenaceae bacterium]|nr:gamma-glutamylcyclotransferase [Alcaligenaceae bacterium]